MAGKQAVYEVFTRFKIDARGWDKSLNRLSRSLDRTGRKMARAGQNLTRSLTLPLALAGGAAVKFSIDLEQSFAKIQNLVGISTDTLKGFTQEVRRISDTTGEAQKSLADALFVITSAGERGADAIKILEQAAKGAAVGLGETKEIARTVTAVLQAYGKENISAARATDVFFSIVREGNLEAESLAGALGPVLGLAAKLGVSFEEVGANIATFTRLGVSAEQAATSLQAIFSTFLKPTDGAKEALAEFGLTAQQVRDSISKNGLADTLVDLVGRVGENDEALAEIIPNIRALRGVLGTAGVQAQSYSDILRSIATNTDLVDKGFQNVSKTAGRRFKIALTNLQNVAIELGNILIPIIVKIVEKATQLINIFKGFSDSTKKTIVIVGLLVAALGPVLFIFGKVFIILGTIVKLFRALNVAVLITVAKVLAVVAAVAGLVAIGVALSRNWENVKTFFVNVWDKIKLAFFKSIEKIKILWASFLTFLGLDASGVLGSIIDAREEIEALQKQVDSQLPTSIQALQLFSSTWDELKGVIGDVTGAAGKFFNKFKGGLGGTSTPIVEPTGGGKQRTDLSVGLSDPSIISAQTNRLKELNEVMVIVNARLHDMNNGFIQQAEKGQQLAEVIGSILANAFDGLGNAIISGFESGKGALQSFLKFFADFAKGLLAKMITLIVTATILAAALAAVGFGVGTAGIAKGISFGKSIAQLLKGGLGIPGLAKGTNFVNQDGLAFLHRGEQIVPANVQGGGFGGGKLVLESRISASDLVLLIREENRRIGNTA